MVSPWSRAVSFLNCAVPPFPLTLLVKRFQVSKPVGWWLSTDGSLACFMFDLSSKVLSSLYSFTRNLRRKKISYFFFLLLSLITSVAPSLGIKHSLKSWFPFLFSRLRLSNSCENKNAKQKILPCKHASKAFWPMVFQMFIFALGWKRWK